MNSQEAAKKMLEVAGLLGMMDTKRYGDPEKWFRALLTGPEYSIFVQESDGKFIFSSEYPKDLKGIGQSWGDDRIQISVSTERPAEAIAKEVRRRFLPKFLERLAVVKERVRKSDEGHQLQEETYERLLDIAGLYSQRNDHFEIYFKDLSLSVEQGGMVYINRGTTSSAVAEKLVKLLAEDEESR
jgi:hypothetical protein